MELGEGCWLMKESGMQPLLKVSKEGRRVDWGRGL
jgi:hypothetical protein